MADSSLKTILGVAAVGAAGVGAIYLLNKKSIDSAFSQVGEALGGVGQALGDFGSGISQGFDDFSKSLGDFGSGISQGFDDFSKSLGDFGSGIQQGLEDVSQDITDQGTDFRKGVTLLSGGLGSGLLTIYEWLTGNPTTTENVTVNEREKSTRSIGEFDPVKSLQFKPLVATDATAIATVKPTPTPITQTNTESSSKAKIEEIKAKQEDLANSIMGTAWKNRVEEIKANAAQSSEIASEIKAKIAAAKAKYNL